MSDLKMLFFDKRTSLLLLFISLPLFFLPKINLISFGMNETAGVRIDDMILLILCPILMWGRFSIRRDFHDIEKNMLALLLLSLISYGTNRFLFNDGHLSVEAKILYTLRIFEYFLFFYIGLVAAQVIDLQKFILLLFLFNGLIMIGQKLEWIGQFTNYGYLVDGANRIVGLSSFPSEAGAFIVLLFCFLLNDSLSSFALFSVTSLLTLITGSRIALAALFFIFFVKYLVIIRKSSIVMFLFSFCLTIVIGSVITLGIVNDDNIFSRSAGLISTKNFDLANDVWNSIDTHYDPTGFEVVEHEDKKYDMSWWMRIHKWCYVLKLYLEHPECWIQGLGPGIATAAIDGGYVRILVEYGITGCILFFSLFRNISKVSRKLFWMVTAFFINMIFFDIHLAYKVMSLLFFTAGAEANKCVNFIKETAEQETYPALSS